MNEKRPLSVLFLCTGNSGRSIIAEAIIEINANCEALWILSASNSVEDFTCLALVASSLLPLHRRRRLVRVIRRLQCHYDITAFMYLGELLEFGATRQMFTAPRDKRTENYVTGRFG